MTDRVNPDASRTEVESFNFFPANLDVIDPQCFYDALRGHFIALAMLTDRCAFSKFYLMISKTNDARGEWWRYTFDWTKDGNQPTGNWGDFDGLGISDDKLVITSRQINFAAGSNPDDPCCPPGMGVVQYQKISVISLCAAYAGQPATRMDFLGLPQPPGGDAGDICITKAGRNLSADPTIHLLTVRELGGARVTYREITGPPSAPSLSAGDLVNVDCYAAPVPEVHANCVNTLNASPDCKTPEFCVRNGVLSIAWHFGLDFGDGNNQNAIRYLRLRTSDRTVLTDETFASPYYSYYYPSVVEDAVGTMFMGFGRSSPTAYAAEYTAPWATGKRRSDANIEPTCVLLHDSFACARGRWGDYTGISFDATASKETSSSAWYAGQWAKSYALPVGTTFGTWNRQLTFTYGKIAGSVLTDADGNAGTTGDRTPAAGVTVTLEQGSTTIGTTTSDAAGAWSFGYLESGTYDCVVSTGCTDVDAVPGTGGTSQTRVSATDIQVALTDAQTSANNLFLLTPDAVAPAATTDLDIFSTDCPSASAVLDWTAAGDDGASGTASAFDLRWSANLITSANFNSAHPLTAPAPGPAGTHETVNVGIGFGATKYFALKTKDGACNTSALSNVIRVDGPPDPDGCTERPLDVAGLPANTELHPPVPNPSNGSARVDYAISADRAGEAFMLAVFDVAGRRLKVLAQGSAVAGSRSVTIDGASLTGSGRKSGVYFVRMTVGDKIISRALAIVR